MGRRITKARCSICSHPDRARIELARISGATLDSIATTYGVHRDAVWRHCAKHVSDDQRAMYLADVDLKGLAERANAESLPQQGVTATASGIDNSRAHSAIEAWANLLADALNNGLRFTSMWLGEKDQTTATVSTDFADVGSSVDEARVLGDAQKRGVISAKTERAELMRRSILGPDFDPDAEDEQLALEQEGLEPEEDTDPITGNVIPLEREAS